MKQPLRRQSLKTLKRGGLKLFACQAVTWHSFGNRIDPVKFKVVCNGRQLRGRHIIMWHW